MEKAVILFLVTILLCGLAGCASNGLSDIPQNTVAVSVDEQESLDLQVIEGEEVEKEEDKDRVLQFVEDIIKKELSNPSAMIVNEVSGSGILHPGSDYDYYRIFIDYSAQNQYGGYDRERRVFYIQATRTGNGLRTVSEAEYYNETDSYVYSDLLSHIEGSDKIPYSLICSDATSADVEDFLQKAGISYTIYWDDNEAQVKDIKYPCRLFNVEGIVTINFYPSTWKIETIEFWKYSGQFYYDGNTREVIFYNDVEDTFPEDVELMVNSINEALSMKMKPALSKETAPAAKYYDCIWRLSESISIYLKHNIGNDNNVVSDYQVKLTNIVNGQN